MKEEQLKKIEITFKESTDKLIRPIKVKEVKINGKKCGVGMQRLEVIIDAYSHKNSIIIIGNKKYLSSNKIDLYKIKELDIYGEE